MHHVRPGRALRLAALAFTALTLAACAADDALEPAADADADADASELAGQRFTVAVQSAWPPIGFLDEDGELTGVALDVAAELSERLGIEFAFEKPAFADMIPGVQSGRYDFGLWGADVTAERLEIVDQLSWMVSGYYLQALDGTEHRAGDDLSGICGLDIALVNGQTTEPTLRAASEACVASGDPEIGILTFPDQPTAELAVESGRADLATVGSQSYAYASEQEPGAWRLASDMIEPHHNGMVFTQGDPVAPVIAEALNAMIDDGTYAAILEEWNVTDSAVDEAMLNPELP
ncbi:transporter substrate-binding domain-containing protein [Streptomyces radicis]|uniref:Solute-binding protein family 3/N-terminal domain-containing protein n=1 Tax=Streptomyces radicis TaxID=1750517 RepID=A0A3A9WSB2_9ACTN|nr:transporter substrate-binding domain-containing protein [Streptomyces radicis]RKN12434.1 hypothetical protein D7319_00200 [Streptomyces radicis]RKN27796.1 hypothetical protein D7318_02690 [Streptomyces radicis]